MKHKIGDDVLVKTRIVNVLERQYIAQCSCGNFYISDEDVQERDAVMTAEEAWGIARRVEMLSAKDINEISGYLTPVEVINNFSPQQAKAKIEAWKAKKEINIGDEVVPKHSPNTDEYKFFVTLIDEDEEEETLSGFSGFNGDVFSCRNINEYQKTGRHIDIEGMLEQIGADE